MDHFITMQQDKLRKFQTVFSRQALTKHPTYKNHAIKRPKPTTI